MAIIHYLQLTRYYWRLIALIVGGVFGATFVISTALLFVLPIYKASSTVTVLPTEAELAYTEELLRGSSMDPTNIMIQTHLEYMLSRPVAERALEKLLAAAPEAPPPPTGWRATLRQGFNTLRRNLRYVYNIVNSGKHVPLTAYEEMLEELGEMIALELMEGSFILEISAFTARPELAPLVANILAEAYVDRARETVAAKANVLADYIGTEIERRRQQVEEVRAREREIRQKLGIIDIAEERQALLAERGVDRQALASDRAALAASEAELNRARALLETVDGRALPTSALMLSLQEQEADLVRNLSEMLTDYGENHPGLLNIRAELESLRSRMGAETGRIANQVESEQSTRKETIQARIHQREFRLAQIGLALGSLVEKERALHAFLAEKERLDSEISELEGRLIQIELSKASGLDAVRVINPAVEPIYPWFPRVVLNSAIGLGAGILLAIFAMIVLDTVSDTVKTTVDMRRAVGERFLGRIPHRLARLLGREGGGLIVRQADLAPLATNATAALRMLGPSDMSRIRVASLGDPAAAVLGAQTVAAAYATHGEDVAVRGPWTGVAKSLGRGLVRLIGGVSPPDDGPFKRQVHVSPPPVARLEPVVSGNVAVRARYSQPLPDLAEEPAILVVRAGTITEEFLRAVVERSLVRPFFLLA